MGKALVDRASAQRPSVTSSPRIKGVSRRSGPRRGSDRCPGGHGGDGLVDAAIRSSIGSGLTYRRTRKAMTSARAVGCANLRHGRG